MNSLMSYGNGSDDDYEDSSEEKAMDPYYAPSKNYRRPGQSQQEDVNYDEVQMSLSEGSGDESKPSREASKRHSRGEESRRTDDRRHSESKPRDDYPKRDRYGSGKEEERAPRQRETGRDEDRTRRGDREEDKGKERRDERRGKSRERYSSSSREDRYRDRKDRRRSRSPRDRDRKRSRSPRRSRSRSRSKDRGNRPGFSKRYDRANFKMDRPEKTDTQKPSEENNDRFFMPGITGRFREQIEKRKLLWQKKEPERQVVGPSVAPPTSSKGAPRATKVWEATTFAQDTDGKVANKFKRLMGIKGAGEGSNTATDVLKKQEEMFSSMEQQYEVARTATHTMRGVGLGFSSYQR